jgi:hypothetical protein
LINYNYLLQYYSTMLLIQEYNSKYYVFEYLDIDEPVNIIADFSFTVENDAETDQVIFTNVQNVDQIMVNELNIIRQEPTNNEYEIINYKVIPDYDLLIVLLNAVKIKNYLVMNVECINMEWLEQPMLNLIGRKNTEYMFIVFCCLQNDEYNYCIHYNPWSNQDQVDKLFFFANGDPSQIIRFATKIDPDTLLANISKLTPEHPDQFEDSDTEDEI